jgi:4-amino-4-deoxy-L-arabinose transferase-like glycosyltransferase
MTRLVVPALLILAGFALRAAPVAGGRFHVDEALYATYAREVAAGGDLLLLAFDVDKPPLGIYVMAASFKLLGVSEFAARVPNLFASVLGMAALYALARRLYPLPRTAVIALLLAALSPYDVLFAPTAFFEPQVMLWVLLAAWAAAGDRWMWAGAFVALGLATKPSMVFYAPLAAALGIVRHAGRGAWLKRAARFAVPLVVGVALLAAWDAPRGPDRSFWALNAAHNTPDRWIRSDEVLPRLTAWGFWLSTFTGSSALNLALMVLAPAGIAWAVVRRARRRETVIDLALACYGVAYFGLLWLRAFNCYDRYVHILLPVVVLLGTRGVTTTLAQAGARAAWVGLAAALIAVLMLAPLSDALAGRLHVGGDKGQYDGIDAVAAFLNTQPGAVHICDHWLGWELGFYLGRSPQAEMTWYPRQDVLAARLADGTAQTPCYLPAPAGAPLDRWLWAVEDAGFRAAEVFATGTRSFVVYRIDTG